MLSMFLASLALVFQSEEALNRKQDHRVTPVVSLTTLAKSLSAEAGIPIAVPPELGERNLYVNVRGKSVREMLDLIAVVTTSEWVNRNGVITIRQTPAHVAAETSRFNKNVLERSRRLMDENRSGQPSVESLTKAIRRAYELATNNQRQWTSEAHLELRKLERLTTSMFIGDKLIESIGIEKLVTMPDEARWVYSSHPTRLQLPFPPALADLVARFNDHRRMVVEAARASNVEIELGRFYQSTLLQPGNFQIDGSASRSVSRLHIVLKRGLVGGRVNVSVFAYDEAGTIVEENAFGSPVDVGWESTYATGDAGEGFADELTLPEEVAQDSRLLNHLYQRDLGEASRQRLVTLLAEDRLTRNRPTVLTEVLDHWVSKRGDLVMEVPVVQAIAEENSSIAPGPVIQSMMASEITEKIDVNGVTVVRPSSPIYRGSPFVPERPLRLAAQRILTGKPLALDDYADIVNLCQSDTESLQVMTWVSVLNAGTQNGLSNYGGVPALRAYGALSKADRAKVKEGGLVYVTPNMPQALKELVEKITAEGEIVPGQTTYQPDYLPEVSTPHGEGMASPTAYFLEPTVFMAFPQYQPMRVSLKFSEVPRVMARLEYSPGEYSVDFYRPEQVGHTNAMRELAKRQGAVWDSAGDEMYAEVTKGSLDLRVIFGQLPSCGANFAYAKVPPDRFVGVGQLPAQIRTEIERAYKKSIETYEKNFTVQPPVLGNLPPPPPR